MEFSKRFLVCSLVLFLSVLVNQGNALKCHQCNSYTQALCSDPFYDEPEKQGGPKLLKTEEFLQDCPKDREYTLCRKIFQNVRGDARVIRSCGWIEYKEEPNTCYTTVLEEYNTEVCTCDKDGCNGSSSVVVSLSAVAFSVLGAYLFSFK